MAVEEKEEEGVSVEEANLMGDSIVGKSSLDGEQAEQEQESTEQDSPEKSPPDKEDSPEPSPDSTDEMPEGYQGKSAAEVAKMHQELAVKLGAQGTELGEHRRLVDEYILSNMQPKKEPAPDISDQMYTDPEGYTQRIKQEAAQEVIGVLPKMLDAREALAKLDTDFPDRKQIVNSPDFMAWQDVNIPPAIKREGDNDPNVAHYVLTQYRATTGNSEAKAKAEENVTTRRRTAAGAASVPASAQAGDKGILKRSDLLDMMKNRKDEYEARQDEIQLAYKEGRVR